MLSLSATLRDSFIQIKGHMTSKPFVTQKDGDFTIGIKMDREVAEFLYGEEGDGLYCLLNKEHEPVVDFEMAFSRDYLTLPVLYFGGDIEEITNVLSHQLLPRLKQIQKSVKLNKKIEKKLSDKDIKITELKAMHVESINNRIEHEYEQKEKSEKNENHVRIPYRSESHSSESESESLISRSSSESKCELEPIFTKSFARKLKKRIKRTSQCQIRAGPMAKYLGRFLSTLKRVRLASEGLLLSTFELAFLHFIQTSNSNFRNLELNQGFSDRLEHLLVLEHNEQLARIPGDATKVLVKLDRS